MLESLRNTKRWLEDARPWKAASRLYLYRDLFHRARGSERSLDEHIDATVGWIKAAQDATGDGGVSGRFRLRSGWTASYPETTGYIVPTFLELARRRGDAELVARAERMISFLLGVQLPSGAFPGGEVGPDPKAVVFNTGQIILGLIAWYEHTGEKRALDALVRAARWLVEVQDQDGAWRRFTYAGQATAYHAHAAWPLAAAGTVTGEKAFHVAASRFVDWTLSLADFETGWIDLMGFFHADHEVGRGFTHTIAYTYKGLVELEKHLGRGDCWELIRTANEKIVRRFERTGRIPGMLDRDWKPAAEGYQCLTGNAQLASIWISLAKRFEDPRFLSAALKAIDVVKRTQVIGSPHPELNGGVAGSFPIWGGYISLAFPNWAAKFFIDAALEAKDAVAELAAKPLRKDPVLPIALPRAEVVEALAQTRSANGKRPLKVVLLSAPGSLKGHDVARALLARGIKPDAVILDAWKDGFEPLKKKVVARLLDHGPGFFLQKAAARLQRRPGVVEVEPSAPPPAPRSIDAVARESGIPTATVLGVNGKAARSLIKAMRPDLLILAGAGIVGHKLLKIPKIGTLNAHMGILPFFRGMNAAEWAVLHGATLGATVHFVDRGIDTGKVVAVREVPGEGIESLDELRRRIDEAQLDLLATTVVALANGHDLPAYEQQEGEGRQFFVMHPEVRRVMEARLKEARRPTGTAA